MDFSDYIVFVDESGDHGLSSIDPEFPVFVLAFCVFAKKHYTDFAVPQAQRIKFEHFGHDQVIFHERQIRKQEHPFAFLKNSDLRDGFMTKLDRLVETSEFLLIAAAIDKHALKAKYKKPDNPYEIALCFCMERLHYYLKDMGQLKKKTTLVVESRGKVEDESLELAFRRIVGGANQCGPMPEMEIIFSDKKCNSTGLQIADLIVRPIGRYVLKPDQPNRAFEIVRKKLRTNAQGVMDGFGLKIFPNNKKAQPLI